MAVQAGSWDDGNSEDARKLKRIYMNAGAFGLIHHVQNENGFQAGFDQLERQRQHAVEVLRIDDMDDEVRSLFNEQTLSRDALFLGDRRRESTYRACRRNLEPGAVCGGDVPLLTSTVVPG